MAENNWRRPVSPLLQAAYDKTHAALDLAIVGALIPTPVKYLAQAQLYFIQWALKRMEADGGDDAEDSYPVGHEGETKIDPPGGP